MKRQFAQATASLCSNDIKLKPLLDYIAVTDCLQSDTEREKGSTADFDGLRRNRHHQPTDDL